MKSAELHAVTVRLDVLRDIMIELVAALPPDRTSGFVTALGDCLTGRMSDIEIHSRDFRATMHECTSANPAAPLPPWGMTQERGHAKHPSAPGPKPRSGRASAVVQPNAQHFNQVREMSDCTLQIGRDFLDVGSPAQVIASANRALCHPINSDVSTEIVLAATELLLQRSEPDQLRLNLERLVKRLTQARNTARRKR